MWKVQAVPPSPKEKGVLALAASTCRPPLLQQMLHEVTSGLPIPGSQAVSTLLLVAQTCLFLPGSWFAPFVGEQRGSMGKLVGPEVRSGEAESIIGYLPIIGFFFT